MQESDGFKVGKSLDYDIKVVSKILKNPVSILCNVNFVKLSCSRLPVPQIVLMSTVQPFTQVYSTFNSNFNLKTFQIFFPFLKNSTESRERGPFS